MLPFLFAALTMLSVKKAAGSIIEEVRRQFREIKGIMDGSGVPEHEKCVMLCTEASIREMLLPGTYAIMSPLFIGFLVGPSCLAGMLAGSIASGSMLAIMMSNAGGAWDNSKKYIEIAGAHGGKGTEVHKACVVGDTVGDPFKDTSGPALNILIKLMTIFSLTMAPVFRSDWKTYWYGSSSSPSRSSSSAPRTTTSGWSTARSASRRKRRSKQLFAPPNLQSP